MTYNALPWLEQSLDSVRGVETVVVDHGSSDGTVAFARERFPEVDVVEEENRGLAYGWNTGVARTHGRWILLLNADAWLDEGALDELVAFGEAHPRAAVVAPRLRYPDGRLQRSVRGFPTLWRIATEYLFIRKLAPRTRALNAFYAGGFDHDRPCRAEWIMGAVWLVRREALDEVGPADDGFFLFSEETDLAWRFRDAGWEVWFDPAAGATHVYGGSHQGRMLAENVKSQLRLLRKHRGDAYARCASLIIRTGLFLRRKPL
ncbi:MAG: glycosyltransferase family 2 protein [Actinomycetota bacterium]